MPSTRPYLTFLITGLVFCWVVLTLAGFYGVGNPLLVGTWAGCAFGLLVVAAPLSLFRPKVACAVGLLATLGLFAWWVLVVFQSVSSGYVGDALFGVVLLGLLAPSAVVCILGIRHSKPWFRPGSGPQGALRSFLAAFPIGLVLVWALSLAARLRCDAGA